MGIKEHIDYLKEEEKKIQDNEASAIRASMLPNFMSDGDIDELVIQYDLNLRDMRNAHIKGLGQKVGMPLSARDIGFMTDGFRDGIIATNCELKKQIL